MTPPPEPLSPANEIVGQGAAEPADRPAGTPPLGAAIFTPPPASQSSQSPPEPPPSEAPPLEGAAGSGFASDEALLDTPESTAIMSPLYRSCSRVRSGLRSAWERVRQLASRGGESSTEAQLPGDHRRLRLVVIAVASVVVVAAVGGLLLGSAHSGDVKPASKQEPLAIAHPPVPSPPGDPPAAKPATEILAKVTTAERAPAERSPAVAKSDSSYAHAKASRARHGLKTRKLAHVRGPSKWAKRHRRARHGRRSARARDARAGALASGADATTRSRAAYREGNAKLFSGDTATAIKAYQEAIRLNRKDPAGYRGLGLAYTQAGKKTAAVKAFARYLKMARSAKDRDMILERLRLLNSQ